MKKGEKILSCISNSLHITTCVCYSRQCVVTSSALPQEGTSLLVWYASVGSLWEHNSCCWWLSKVTGDWFIGPWSG